MRYSCWTHLYRRACSRGDSWQDHDLLATILLCRIFHRLLGWIRCDDLREEPWVRIDLMKR